MHSSYTSFSTNPSKSIITHPIHTPNIPHPTHTSQTHTPTLLTLLLITLLTHTITAYNPILPTPRRHLQTVGLNINSVSDPIIPTDGSSLIADISGLLAEDKNVQKQNGAHSSMVFPSDSSWSLPITTTTTTTTLESVSTVIGAQGSAGNNNGIIANGTNSNSNTNPNSNTNINPNPNSVPNPNLNPTLTLTPTPTSTPTSTSPSPPTETSTPTPTANPPPNQTNYIKNGNFLSPSLSTHTKIYKQNNPEPVSSWEYLTIEISQGNYHNPLWEKEIICQLTPQRLGLIKQTINLLEGLYILKFKWGMNIDNQKSEMAVRFNGQLRAYINSACMEKTHSLYETSIVLAVEEEEKYELAFLATDQNPVDSKGMTLADVRLYELTGNELKNYQTLGQTQGQTLETYLDNGDFKQGKASWDGPLEIVDITIGNSTNNNNTNNTNNTATEPELIHTARISAKPRRMVSQQLHNIRIGNEYEISLTFVPTTANEGSVLSIYIEEEMLGEYVSVMGNVSARNASIGVAETHTFVFVALIPTPTLRLYGSANRRDEGVNIMNVGLRFVRNGLIRHSVLRTMEEGKPDWVVKERDELEQEQEDIMAIDAAIKDNL